MTCTNCPAFKICPEKPTKEAYADENKYLIYLECGVWSCQKTIEKLCKENEQVKQKLDWFLTETVAGKEYRPKEELEELQRENEQLKEYNADLKQSLDWANKKETEWSNRIEELKTDLEYAKAIVKDLLNNSHEYARQNAEQFIKGEKK